MQKDWQDGPYLSVGYDGKGVPIMRSQTNRAEESVSTRLAKGQKKGVKKEATLSLSSCFTPQKRSVEEILNSLFSPQVSKTVEQKKKKHRWHENKHIRAFLSDKARAICYGIENLLERDETQSKPIVVLIDGDRARNLWKNKLYTLINILGLGIGIAVMVWAYQNYRYSMSFDDFHPDVENVYRGLIFQEGSDRWSGWFPLAMAKMAEAEFSSISETVRLLDWGQTVELDNGESFGEWTHYTDPAFFEFFNFPLLKGSNDLNDRSAVLITERIAKKYFGDRDPIGQTITFYADTDHPKPLKVKGVLKNTPENSTIFFNFLTHIDNHLKTDGEKIQPDEWRWFTTAVYFKIPNKAEVGQLATAFDKYIPLQNEAREDWKATGFKLISLKENAQTKEVGGNNLRERPDDSATFAPIILALLILLSACLNFANTTVARSNRRLKELGVRKVLGGTKGELRSQLLMECGMIVLIGISISILINLWWIPTFNDMFVFVNAQANYLQDPKLLLFMGLILVSTTLLAGAYPAFYMSRFDSNTIFRGSVKFGNKNLFSRLLLGFQIIVSVITTVAGLAFANNSEFQRTYSFGYDKENIINLRVPNESAYYAMRDKIQDLSGVEEMTGSRSLIAYNYWATMAEAEEQKWEVSYMGVGDNFVKTMDLNIATGRDFEKTLETDLESSLLITQKMAGMYNWTDESAIGKTVRIDTVNYSVIGVLEDFHMESFFDPLEPVAMKMVGPEDYFNIVVRVKPGELTTTFEQMKTEWNELFPMREFGGFYHNEIGAEALNVTSNIAKIFSWLAIVTILLTVTGLFALISQTILKKMKEIAVRRVVGAEPKHIIFLVNKGYFWILLVAVGIGSYAGYALTKVLLDLIFQVNSGVGVPVLIIATCFIFSAVLVTIGIKIWDALRSNPAEVLKSE